MKFVIFFSIVCSLIAFKCIDDKKYPFIKVTYSVTKKTDSVDTYFGYKIGDPYRWLENDNSEETAEWVKKQNEVTNEYFSKIPFKEKIKDRLTKMWNFPKISAPFKAAGKYYFYKNTGLQNQSVLYVIDSLNSEPRVFLDPNSLSTDGTVALNGMAYSNDKKYFAYSVARSGSDWNEIYVKDINSQLDLEDHLSWVKFSSIAWYKDGFFYSRYDAPEEGKALSKKNQFHKMYYHKLGTNQSEDALVYKNDNEPLRTYAAYVPENEKYLFIYEGAASKGNALQFKKLDNSENEFKYIVQGFDYEFNVIECVENFLYIRTNYQAPKYKLIKIDLNKIDSTNWIEIIPEKENVLDGCTFAGNKIVCSYMKNAYNKIEIYSNEGKYEKDIELSTICTVNSINGKINDNTLFYSISTFTSPGLIYKYSLNNDKSEIYFKSEIDFDESQYITKQEFAKSKDGTMIPMFIVHKKNIKMNGKNPALLYGYGGFNISMTPKFKASNLIWLENGGVYVVACLRGGGEFGDDWHKQGTKLQKQNVFDDFIACAEYLIEKQYTNSSVLAMNGGSNGGLLVGAVTNQRPELFKVALPAVGVMDMLRFHKFTIGWSWTSDYGSSDDSTEFKYIYKYSPLHNIKVNNTNYPAILVTTADHDDRVVPAHSFKYAATLQEYCKGSNPVLIRIDAKAGHGSGKPVSKQIEQAADMWAFTFYNMGIDLIYK